MKIIVVGGAGEGKSTIARLIQSALLDKKFVNIKVVDSLAAEEAHLSHDLKIWHQKKRLEALAAKRAQILIETLQVNKKATEDIQL